MKKLVLLIIGLVGAHFQLQAQHSEGNPFARLGYKADVYTFGEDKEFHDQAVTVEIGNVVFNTKTREVIGFVEDADTLIELNPELQSMSIDPHCEKYYSVTPYAYCMNNPVKYIDPDGKDVAILIAKEGAGGYGHMAAVIQNKKGDYYYMTVGNTDGRATTLSGISSGAEGGMLLKKIEFGKEDPSMQSAIKIIGEVDKNNSTYTDNIILKTSSKMDNAIFVNAAVLKDDLAKGSTQYNAISNNCADAVKSVVEKGTRVDIPMGSSPKPNNNFETIKENKDRIQIEINKKIQDEK